MPSKAIGVSRASAKPKIRAAEQVQLDESLEEAVCKYIENSEVNPGEGMTLDHLSREDSFHHPDKPKGRRFTACVEDIIGRDAVFTSRHMGRSDLF